MMLQDAKVSRWSSPIRNNQHQSHRRRAMQEVIKSDSGHRVELWVWRSPRYFIIVTDSLKDGPFPVTLITAAALGNPPQP